MHANDDKHWHKCTGFSTLFHWELRIESAICWCAVHPCIRIVKHAQTVCKWTSSYISPTWRELRWKFKEHHRNFTCIRKLLDICLSDLSESHEIQVRSSVDQLAHDQSWSRWNDHVHLCRDATSANTWWNQNGALAEPWHPKHWKSTKMARQQNLGRNHWSVWGASSFQVLHFLPLGCHWLFSKISGQQAEVPSA